MLARLVSGAPVARALALPGRDELPAAAAAAATAAATEPAEVSGIVTTGVSEGRPCGGVGG